MSDMLCGICGGQEIKEKRDFEFHTPDGDHHVIKDVPMFVCFGECKERTVGPEGAEMISRGLKQISSPQ